MTIDFVRDDPFILADRATLDELWEAVQATKPWTDRAAEVLDHIYQTRVGALLRTQASTGELVVWSKHIGRVAHPLLRGELEHLNKAYISRWHALRDLLDNRLAVRQYPLPGLLLRREHVRDVLQRVADGRIRTQAELDSYAAGINDHNLPRSLKQLEQLELIRHCIIGGKKCLTLGFRAAYLPEGYLQDMSTMLGITPRAAPAVETVHAPSEPPEPSPAAEEPLHGHEDTSTMFGITPRAAPAVGASVSPEPSDPLHGHGIEQLGRAA